MELVSGLEWAKLPAWISAPRSSQNFQDFLCTPLPYSNTYCQEEVLRWLHSFLSPGNRHAGCNFRSLFRNRFDSHLYLGLQGWPATTTSMWLQPPPSGGGVRWIATELPQRQPRVRFYCELLRTSRTCLQRKARHNGCQCSVFIFRPARGIPDLLLFVHASLKKRYRERYAPQRC